MKNTKRGLLILTVLLCVLAFAACTGGKQQAYEEVQKVLGTPEELPFDLAAVKERLGEETVCGKLETNDTEESYEIVIGKNVVVVYYTLDSELELASGDTYPITARALLVGKAETRAENEFSLTFLGGNFGMALEAEDVQSVTAQFVADLEATFDSDEFATELSQTDRAVYLSFAQGKKVWASAQSFLWRGIITLDEEATILYDVSGATFRKEDKNAQKCVRTYYPDGSLESETYYQPDGEKISEKKTYAYPAGGGTEVSYISYWPDGKTVLDEGYSYYVGAENTSERPLNGWSKQYRDDGVLYGETQINEDGTDLHTYYDENGLIAGRRLCRYRDDTIEPQEIWKEEYENGTIRYRTERLDENTTVSENYSENGTMTFRKKWEGDYSTYEGFDENGELTFYSYDYEKMPESEDGEYISYPLLEKFVSDGKPQSREYTYDENWNCTRRTDSEYDEEGEITARWLIENDSMVEYWQKGYMDNEADAYYADGYERTTYHPNGHEKVIEKWYAEGKQASYAELDEQYTTIVRREYNTDGELTESRELLENGDSKWITINPNPENENDFIYEETIFDADGNSKSQLWKYGNGAYSYWVDNRDGTSYSIRDYADGTIEEMFYKESGDLSCWRTYIAGELYQELYYQGETLIYKYEDGKVFLGERPSWDPQAKE